MNVEIFNLNTKVMSGLRAQGYTTPTPIQQHLKTKLLKEILRSTETNSVIVFTRYVGNLSYQVTDEKASNVKSE